MNDDSLMQSLILAFVSFPVFLDIADLGDFTLNSGRKPTQLGGLFYIWQGYREAE